MSNVTDEKCESLTNPTKLILSYADSLNATAIKLKSPYDLWLDLDHFTHS